MGIQLHQDEIGMTTANGGNSTGADRVLSAQHQRFEPKIQYQLGCFLNGVNNWLRGAEGNVDSAKVGEVNVFEIAIELGAVGLKTIADVANGAWPKATAGHSAR